MKENQVSIVIPVYGQWDLVKLSIEKNFEFDSDQVAEIIIVDDCSVDANPYQFTGKVRVIRNERNLRYSGAVNVGLRAATCEVIVLLDSDARPVSSYIPRLLEIYKEDVIGCVGFKTIDEQGNDTGNYDYEPTLAGFIAGQNLHSKFKRFDFLSEKRILPFSCAVSFRKRCLEEMNYLDEKNFPVLDADNDMSMRIHRSRWKLLFTKEIEIYHKGGNSIPRNHKRVLVYHQSRWRLLMKYGLIRSELLAKWLIASRIRLELLILRMCLMVRRDAANEDKLKGRQILLQEIKKY